MPLTRVNIYTSVIVYWTYDYTTVLFIHSSLCETFSPVYDCELIIQYLKHFISDFVKSKIFKFEFFYSFVNWTFFSSLF